MNLSIDEVALMLGRKELELFALRRELEQRPLVVPVDQAPAADREVDAAPATESADYSVP